MKRRHKYYWVIDLDDERPDNPWVHEIDHDLHGDDHGLKPGAISVARCGEVCAEARLLITCIVSRRRSQGPVHSLPVDLAQRGRALLPATDHLVLAVLVGEREDPGDN